MRVKMESLAGCKIMVLLTTDGWKGTSQFPAKKKSFGGEKQISADLEVKYETLFFIQNIKVYTVFALFGKRYNI